MTGQAERSTKKKQPSRSKGRGWNSPQEQSNVGTHEAEPSWTRSKARGWNSPNEQSNVETPEAEPSWTSWKTEALEAEPSWTPWQGLATPWKMGYVVTPEAEPSWTSWKTKALEAEPSWKPWGGTIEQIVLKDISWTSDLKAAPTRNIRTERMRECEPSPWNITNT